MIKTSEIREKTMGELKEEEAKLIQELFDARMKHATGQLTNPKTLWRLRRELARVKTIRKEKEINLR